jgi:BirA family transcriptional regulator, biotin operon repressor / biotin---[acetyl-CoA-carboxylase] ligase
MKPAGRSFPSIPEGKRLEELIALTPFLRLTDIRITYLKSVDSTQNFMTEVIRSDREGDVVISEIQTEGKGREGRSWSSQKGGLWMTITLKPPSGQLLENIVPIAAAAVVKTLETYGVEGLSIKPPNDVVCNGRKIAGLLADTVVQGSNLKVLLGVGMDVNNDVSNDASISQIASSVSRELGKEVDLEECTVSFLRHLDAEYSNEIQSQEM